MTFGHDMLKHWALDPDIIYLNHGTVGAVPRRVLAAQQAIRDAIERQPSQFLLRELADFGASIGAGTKMRQAAASVAAFLGAEGEDLVFVDNATAGANAVLRSFAFESGDEILLTNHSYGAVARTVEFVARERQAVVRTVDIPYPAFERGPFIEAITAAFTSRTRVAVIDHITSESALILPLAEIAARCRDRGVLVLADGAHAPGVLPLDIPSLGVDWYVANLHKWAHAPRSCGILWAAPEHQPHLHPPVISWGLGEGFTQEFDWTGTRDPSPWLAAPDGIAFLEDMGFEAARRYNHDLAWQSALSLSDQWGTTLSIDEASVGSMVTIPLPDVLGDSEEAAAALRSALLFDDRIEVQLHAGHGRLWVRISAQVYNDPSDVQRLGTAVTRRARERRGARGPH
jgi:isopenicillin-N epimerase